jgi:bifunctional aspartokinase / homoserine dehydrogenase 1
MKVVKIGGGCLKGIKNIQRIITLAAERCQGDCLVVSALNGITDRLIAGMDKALAAEDNIPKIINQLASVHLKIARDLMPGGNDFEHFNKELKVGLKNLERLYYGLNFTREITPRMRDIISSFGERFSAQLLTALLGNKKLKATTCMPHQIGLVTDGRYGDATADMTLVTKNLHPHIGPAIKNKGIVVIPGFYGISKQGEITTFGRGGSDYSAAVIAAALGAQTLEIWKDVDGFMSADPRMVPEAELIPRLSYAEAAELSYFGARILHPRTVEPVRKKKIPIVIKNTLAPDNPGSLINSKSPRHRTVIKSVAHDTDIGILKVHASAVGARPGILARVAGQITENGINIKSVVTSQTCISLLFAKEDLEKARLALKELKPRPYRRIEKLEHVALLGIVGEGLLKKKGIAARCFTAVAGCNVNVEMISFGPSKAALYFLVKMTDLPKAITAIHSTFFSDPRCVL